MKHEIQTETINALFEAWNSHELERIISFYTPQCESIDIAQPPTQRGQIDMRQWIAGYLQAVPDIQFLCEEIISEDNRAVAVWNATGTHRGFLMNIPPTHKTLSVRGVSVFSFAENRIDRVLNVWDVAELLRDIGLLPEL